MKDAVNGASALTRRISNEIVELIESHRLQPGTHLPAKALAEEFSVSRSPVQEALVLLERVGVVQSQKNRGFFVAANENGLESAKALFRGSDKDADYFRIAKDRVAGKLPEQFTENDLIRHYGLTRPQMQGTLLRMAREGWIERKLGYGWQFLPVLTSPYAHSQTYRLRMAIEPAALFEPTFRVDKKVFSHWRDVQERLLDATDIATPDKVFEIGSQFHEMVMRCSHNPFFMEVLQQHNRLRRLLEYQIPIDRNRLVIQCNEHIELLDRLEDGDRYGASILLQRHLDVIRVSKSRHLAERSAPDGEESPISPHF